MKQKGIAPLIIILILAIIGAAGYFGYKYFLPQINNVIPTPEASITGTPIPELPVVTEPKANTKIVSPLTIRGTVPPGWMFEGVFPVKLVDTNQKLIAGGQATEEVPGAWQSNVSVYFTATLTFTTSAKSGFIILENDNPSGNPANAKTFEVPVNINCTPRPACLDATPRCMIPETSDMCPPTSAPGGKACTMEAKLCPNGSYVGRTGPNCEFSACPSK